MNKPQALDYSLLAVIGLIWGSQFIFNAVAIESFEPLTVAAGRVFIGFATISLALLVLPKDQSTLPPGLERQPWGLYAVIALVEAILPCFLIPWGQQHVDSSIAAILLATVPLFTLVLAPILVPGERWSLIAAASAIVGFIGVIVLVGPNIAGDPLADVVGELAILGGALSFALGLILMKRLPAVPPLLAMRNIFMVGSVPLVAVALATGEVWPGSVTTNSALSLLALGVLCGGLAYVLFIIMVRRTGPTFTSLVGYLVTLIGVFLGIIFMGDALHPLDFVALVLIIGALALTKLKKD